MKRLLTVLLPAELASLSTSAGVAPTGSNSALAQSGAKVATPAKQSSDDKDGRREHQENTAKESSR